MAEMQLLVTVVNEEEKLDEILAGFLELGVTGATVIHTEGMARLLSQEIPIFAGLQTLMSRSRPRNFTIFSVIDDSETADQVVALVEDICGDLDRPGTGIIFSVPVTRAVGLAPELEDPGG